LLASMQITSYNPHLGLLRSEHCWGEHRTVYSGRREADVVMTSIRHYNNDTVYNASLTGHSPTTYQGAAMRSRFKFAVAIAVASLGVIYTKLRPADHQLRGNLQCLDERWIRELEL
jgi:hypothetical protein